MILIIETLLREIVDATVRAVDPEQMILFGSYARGDVKADSSLDLLVVERGPFGKQRSRRADIYRIRQVLWKCPMPVEVLVFTPEEMNAWRGGGDHVIARALREGRILYQRPCDAVGSVPDVMLHSV